MQFLKTYLRTLTSDPVNLSRLRECTKMLACIDIVITTMESRPFNNKEVKHSQRRRVKSFDAVDARWRTVYVGSACIRQLPTLIIRAIITILYIAIYIVVSTLQVHPERCMMMRRGLLWKTKSSGN